MREREEIDMRREEEKRYEGERRDKYEEKEREEINMRKKKEKRYI